MCQIKQISEQRIYIYFLFVVNFIIHWNETSMGLHVFPIPIPPPTSLSTRSPQVFPVHQVRALVRAKNIIRNKDYHFLIRKGCHVHAPVMSGSLQPYGLQPARLLCPWDSPGKNIGVACHALLQGIFLTQGSNLCLSHPPTLAGRSFTTELPGKP